MKLLKVHKRSGIDPIIAALLLIAIAVGAGIIVYVFVTGLAGNLTGSGGQQVTEQVSMDAYVYSPISGGVAVYVRNVGTATTTVDSGAMFFDGLNAPASADTATYPGTACRNLAPAYQMSVGTVCYITFTTTPAGVEAATAGTSHVIKVVSATGGTFVYSVLAGRSG